MRGMDVDHFANALTDEAQLRAIYDPPAGLAALKDVDRLDEHCRAFIAACPFVLVASTDADGRCDVTPRGGTPGFVTVLDDGHLAIPDATGNRRIDSLRNLVATGQAGLLFVIPGRGSTLRVNGRAAVSADPDLLARLTPVGRPPRTAVVVAADEVFTHCPKALVRSGLWDPARWPSPDAQPSAAAMLHDHVGDPRLSLAEVERALEESVTVGLD